MVRKIRAGFIAVILALAMTVGCLFTGCNNGNAGGENIGVDIVEMNTALLTVGVGESGMLSATVLPENATDKSETWHSENTEIAVVNSVGRVTGKAVGETTVSVTIGGKTTEGTVRVIDKSAVPVRVSGVKLNKQRVTLTDVGKTVQLKAIVEPKNATNKGVTFTTSNDKIATVSKTGLVTAVAGGTATVTVETDDLRFNATCLIKVDVAVEESNELYVRKIDSLENRTDFIMGMDASAVPSVEAARKASNSPLYKNFDGEEEDVFKILKDNGVTDIRVRVWNDPTDGNGNSYGGGNCDLANAVEIAERCEAVGLGVIVDFHYSDFWADPSKQRAPKAWKNYTEDQMEQAIYDYTLASLNTISETGVKITMVQVGNETTGAVCGSGADWTKMCKYFASGSRAVREATGAVADGGAKVAIHFTNPVSANYLDNAAKLDAGNVDYDVFGSSYYSYYGNHGSLTNIKNKLESVHDTYGKEVMILETAYSWTMEDFDGLGNHKFDVSANTPQPRTVQGMANSVASVIQTVADFKDNCGIGVCYWEGTWIAASSSEDSSVNRELCVEYGCGWATEYASGYDGDANNGGTQVDCDAFWDSRTGEPLEALKVFKLVKTGQVVDLKPDYIPQEQLFYTVDQGPIELPTTIAGIALNSGEVVTDKIVWDVTDAELARYIGEVGTHVISGITANYGGVCTIEVRVTNENLLANGSFEDGKAYQKDKFIQPDGELAGWKTTHTGGSEELQLYVSDDASNIVTGAKSFHFWDKAKVDFKLFNAVDLTKLTSFGNGNYTASFDVQGGSGKDMDIYAYIIVTYNDGSEQTTVIGNKVELTKWADWKSTKATVEIADLSKVASITVGINVTADVVETGPWGNIDNCQFYFDGAQAQS